MSASSKKKLRNDQAAEKLTEKQQAERKQSKEIKFYTMGFAAVMAVLLIVAIFVGGQRMVANSGVREKKTVAYTVGEHQLSAADMSFFFVDAVNRFANQYGAYASMMGLDPSKPLDEQYVDAEGTRTWADDFMQTAKDSAKSVYTMVDAANAAGHTLSDSDKEQLENAVATAELYGEISGAGSAKAYLKAVYGPGATMDGYRNYLENSILADSYRTAYAESLKFEDADLREAEKDNFDAYSSFTYNQYYLDASKFLQGGTKAEDGTMTYSQEEKAAAAKAAEEALKPLTEAKTAEDLDKAIAAMDVNKDSSAVSTAYVNNDYRNISPDYTAWMSEASRTVGDVKVIPSTSTTTGEDGKEVTNTDGFTVILYLGKNDNTEVLPNVRHILVGLEGGTQNEQGQMVYSDEEKAAAREKAEALLKTFTEGEKTEEAFAALATENTTDPGSKENGGLYENVYRGQMVPTFNDWVFAEGRKAGDTGIVESDFGFHVMYYCGEGTLSYRDLQLTTELTNEAMQTWFDDLLSKTETVDGDFSRINTGVVLSRA